MRGDCNLNKGKKMKLTNLYKGLLATSALCLCFEANASDADFFQTAAGIAGYQNTTPAGTQEFFDDIANGRTLQEVNADLGEDLDTLAGKLGTLDANNDVNEVLDDLLSPVNIDVPVAPDVGLVGSPASYLAMYADMPANGAAVNGRDGDIYKSDTTATATNITALVDNDVRILWNILDDNTGGSVGVTMRSLLATTARPSAYAKGGALFVAAPGQVQLSQQNVTLTDLVHYLVNRTV